MQRIGLQLRATLENITRLRAEGEDFRWYLKVRAAGAGIAAFSLKTAGRGAARQGTGTEGLPLCVSHLSPLAR